MLGAGGFPFDEPATDRAVVEDFAAAALGAEAFEVFEALGEDFGLDFAFGFGFVLAAEGFEEDLESEDTFPRRGI